MDNSTFALPSVAAPTGGDGVSHRSLSAGAIAGVVVGVVALVFVLFVLFFSCFFRKKREIVMNLSPQGQNQIGPYSVSIGIPTSTVNKRQQINTNQHSGNPKNSSNLMEERFKISTPYEEKQTKSTQRLLHHNSSPAPPATPPLGSSKITFSYKELAVATNRFSDANLLGQGGFGYVHLGILPDGRTVAVKQMKADSGQGESEFEAEVEIISRVHHRYLVSLVGYCIHEEKRLLVYEFVPNKTLDFHLHGKGQPTMTWSTRLKVALGSAKGLAYLHEDCIPKIIHRDVKAANILVDFNFEVKVADFGLAKLTADVDQTHISTRVMGTFGYLAPEYASTGKLSDKSDVYSYGVMLLELITGHRPILAMGESLADWARPLLTEALENNDYEPLIDPRMEGNYDIDEVERLVACAAACIRHSAKKRPKMGQVVRVLEGGVSLEELNAGVTPGHSTIYSASGSSNTYDSEKYREDLKRFRMMALESEEEASTSDYTSSSNTSKQYPSSGFFSGEAPRSQA